MAAGRPASIMILLNSQLDSIAPGHGFHTTTFPTMMGARIKLTANAVKLNGDTAQTKLSKGLCSERLDCWVRLNSPYFSRGPLTYFRTTGVLNGG